MVLFTTGRGTPFGTYVPTMKISTNSTLAKNKPGWIDFNAGVIVENEPMEKTCERFIDYIIKVASGEFVNNEKKGYREIAIFKDRSNACKFIIRMSLCNCIVQGLVIACCRQRIGSGDSLDLDLPRQTERKL